MKIEILMLKENNERGVRMMFLSLEQLQKLKLNPTRADYEIAYETEVKEQEGTALNVSEIMEGLYERLNRPDRPNRKTMRSMSVGDIIQIDGKELFFCDSVGFKKISFAGTGELVLKAGKENSENRDIKGAIFARFGVDAIIVFKRINQVVKIVYNSDFINYELRPVFSVYPVFIVPGCKRAQVAQP